LEDEKGFQALAQSNKKGAAAAKEAADGRLDPARNSMNALVSVSVARLALLAEGRVRRTRPGSYETASIGGETVRAFVPMPLPPNPPLHLKGRLRDAVDAALLALGRLDGVSSLLPDVNLFLYTYVRKEAVLSSQIEGTQSTLADLLLFELKEAPGVPVEDTVEVSNYVRAMDHALRRIRGGFPLSNRLEGTEPL